MSKFTLASMAVLCLLMSSCAKQEANLDTNTDTQLSLRSSERISVKLVDLSGTEQSYSATDVTITYRDNYSATIQLAQEDGTTVIEYGDNLSLSVSEEYTMSIVIDASAPVETDDLQIDVCGTTLCYSNLAENLSGQALEFIVEDVATGF